MRSHDPVCSLAGRSWFGACHFAGDLYKSAAQGQGCAQLGEQAEQNPSQLLILSSKIWGPLAIASSHFLRLEGRLNTHSGLGPHFAELLCTSLQISVAVCSNQVLGSARNTLTHTHTAVKHPYTPTHTTPSTSLSYSYLYPPVGLSKWLT